MNSLCDKLHYDFNLINSNNLDIVPITETWLTANCSTSFVDIPGFAFLRGDVNGLTRKHGAGIYISNKIKFVQEDVNLPNVVLAYLVDLEVYVASIYRPPSYTVEENELLMAFIRDLVVGREVVLMGDFNLPSLAWPLENIHSNYVSPVDRSFLDCFLDSGLTQWVDFGTFFPAGNVLDIVLSTDDDRVFDVVSEPPFPACHHVPVLFKVAFQIEDSECEQDPGRNWFKADLSSFGA